MAAGRNAHQQQRQQQQQHRAALHIFLPENEKSSNDGVCTLQQRVGEEGEIRLSNRPLSTHFIRASVSVLYIYVYVYICNII